MARDLGSCPLVSRLVLTDSSPFTGGAVATRVRCKSLVAPLIIDYHTFGLLSS